MPPPRFRKKSVKRRNSKRKSMRRRSSSKIRYSRGGAPEVITSLSDLSNPDWVSYQIVTYDKSKDKNIVIQEGEIKYLNDEDKKNLFEKYANNPEYTFNLSWF
jgi:hypothetical protein